MINIVVKLLYTKQFVKYNHCHLAKCTCLEDLSIQSLRLLRGTCPLLAIKCFDN